MKGVQRHGDTGWTSEHHRSGWDGPMERINQPPGTSPRHIRTACFAYGRVDSLSPNAILAIPLPYVESYATANIHPPSPSNSQPQTLKCFKTPPNQNVFNPGQCHTAHVSPLVTDQSQRYEGDPGGWLPQIVPLCEVTDTRTVGRP